MLLCRVSCFIYGYTVIMQSVMMLNVIMLIVIMLSVTMLSVTMLSVTMLSVIMLSVIILSVEKLSFAAPSYSHTAFCRYYIDVMPVDEITVYKIIWGLHYKTLYISNLPQNLSIYSKCSDFVVS
jgi:hypothetical protein